VSSSSCQMIGGGKPVSPVPCRDLHRCRRKWTTAGMLRPGCNSLACGCWGPDAWDREHLSEPMTAPWNLVKVEKQQSRKWIKSEPRSAGYTDVKSAHRRHYRSKTWGNAQRQGSGSWRLLVQSHGTSSLSLCMWWVLTTILFYSLLPY
jgi:hypothetical protein